MSTKDILLSHNTSFKEHKNSFTSSIDYNNRTTLPMSSNNSDTSSNNEFFLSLNEDNNNTFTPPKEETNIITINNCFQDDDMEDLEIQNELLEFKKNLTSFKSKLKRKQKLSENISYNHNSNNNNYNYNDNSNINTLTLIEKEINISEDLSDFDYYNDELTLSDNSISERKTNSLTLISQPNNTLLTNNDNNYYPKAKSTSLSFEAQPHPFSDNNNKRFSLSSNISSNNDYFLNYSYRTNADSLRISYMSKLINTGILSPNQQQTHHNSIIIFDWDDTLLCTSFLMPNGIYNDNKSFTYEEKQKLSQLESSVISLLEKSISKGRTFIITNSLPGWVEFSARKFYPKLMDLLDKITIISARGEYEKIYPGNTRLWKIKAFGNIIKTIDCSLITNIVCIGDSFIEIEAGKVLASKFSMACIKFVKFKEYPGIEELDKQIQLVYEGFDKIFAQAKNLNISIEKNIAMIN